MERKQWLSVDDLEIIKRMVSYGHKENIMKRVGKYIEEAKKKIKE